MRVLQVIHQFPPYSSQGSEVYCDHLSRCLREAGDDVRVFHVSNTDRRRPRRLERLTLDGLPTYHCIDGAEYARVAAWPNGFLRRQFQAVLDEFKPQVSHFHNYLSLGDDLVTLARAAGAVLYTLHDYGLMCPNSLLLRSDGQLCGKASSDFFQDCCPELIRTAHHLPAALMTQIPPLARWRRYADQQTRPGLRRVMRSGVRIAESLLGQPAVTDVAVKREFFLARTRQIFRDANLFLAPSEFLRQRYISSGVPADRIVYLPNGMPHFARVDRTPGGHRVRFGYIGALHAHKGIDLLLQAFEGLHEQAELHIHGSAFGSPISQSYWRRIQDAHGARVTFHGAYDNRNIGAVLSSLDVVVVPSLWYENSPLTIQEAFIAGVPVITADQGGMAELVRHDVNGLLFRLGDREHLRAALRRVADEPALLERLRRNIPDVPDIARQAGLVRTYYEGVLS
ncbi:MAG TPA: glycosyltransferase [Vicinamibacterales bacterium]|nr:glycosyltransferase [Vicinamibacterales bacterium]